MKVRINTIVPTKRPYIIETDIIYTTKDGDLSNETLVENEKNKKCGYINS